MLTIFSSYTQVFPCIFSTFEKDKTKKCSVLSLFNQRKNKRFSYTPRHRDEQVAKDSQRFDLKWLENRKQQRKSSTMPWLLIGLGMVIVLWYVLNNYQN